MNVRLVFKTPKQTVLIIRPKCVGKVSGGMFGFLGVVLYVGMVGKRLDREV
jgi:hypothetical protein